MNRLISLSNSGLREDRLQFNGILHNQTPVINVTTYGEDDRCVFGAQHANEAGGISEGSPIRTCTHERQKRLVLLCDGFISIPAMWIGVCVDT